MSGTNKLGLTPTEMRRLPRHKFKLSGVNCGHGDHDRRCLCDVQLPEQPVGVLAAPLLFASTALKAMDAEHVSEGNLYEFASYLLGCYDKYRTLPQPRLTTASLAVDDDRDEAIEWVYPDGTVRPDWAKLKQGSSPWTQLPAATIDRLVAGYQSRVPWEAARLGLPEWVRDHDEVYIERHYKQHMSRFGNVQERVAA